MTKALLITGGARGIGAATARLAGARGWRVGVNYRKERDAAEAVAADVIAAGGQAVALPGDVSDPEAVTALFASFEAAFGKPDAVVVNAGVLGPRGKLVDFSPDRLRWMLEVNSLGALLTAQAAARAMAGGGGAIVFVSSAAARLGSGGEFVDYAASKGAVDTLTIGLSRELGPDGVRVNAVRPGLIETDMQADSGWPERAAALGANCPLGRAGTPEEVAEAIVWLCSDAALYVTGAFLDVAGGR